MLRLQISNNYTPTFYETIRCLIRRGKKHHYYSVSMLWGKSMCQRPYLYPRNVKKINDFRFTSSTYFLRSCSHHKSMLQIVDHSVIITLLIWCALLYHLHWVHNFIYMCRQGYIITCTCILHVSHVYVFTPIKSVKMSAVCKHRSLVLTSPDQ